jgi:NhaC family Na+:H+ antiporter
MPAAGMTLLLFWMAGGPARTELSRVDPMIEHLHGGWWISGVHLVPIAGVFIMTLRKVPTLLLLFVNVVVAGAWAMLFQRASLARVLSAASVGVDSNTGLESVDEILSRGGVMSMNVVVVLILIAGALGGALGATGVLETLVRGLLRWVRGSGNLVASVLGTCYAVILLTGNQGLALVLGGQMFLPAFRERRIDRSVLTRSLEDSGTLAAPLVPWGVAGGYCSQVLGVSTTHYLPYAWLAFAVPLFALALAYTGLGIWPAPPEDGEPSPQSPR